METAFEFLRELYGNINIAAVLAVFILVWLWGQLGLTGKYQLLSSFVTGVVLGIADKYFNSALTTGAEWFLAVIYGIVLGGLASGAYESIKKVVAKGLLSLTVAREYNIDPQERCAKEIQTEKILSEIREAKLPK